ncbi:hypothetical protein PXK00_04230 [Phaeobacter sp. QD34_3]|uniref:hypothetical protein n=1 Tax=unclassified Phaeobacter TaxID=2621772 RepID=UPI00237EF257|nr:MULTISPECIES: hypothetical protein [unclassified Phaeobacter]MDE4132304.1 hypothetical protein [Phaeobacter sp. QD34_3]MDE4135942.1 hypothetical protein [Phaeobacter sp. QD34_24]MDE4173764.1 hypothetical protein [Phaeobacter sp. PT47_59]
MDITRNQAETPNADRVSVQINGLKGPCVGCSDCVGMCRALIDALTVPDAILKKAPRS